MVQKLRKSVFWIVLAVVALALAYVLLLMKPIQIINNGSMVPTLPVGTTVLVLPADHVSAGQIITFKDDDGFVVTHRVVGVASDGSISTKGDANQTVDLHTVPLRMDHVVGVVLGGFGVPWWSVVSTMLALLALVLVLSSSNDKKDELKDDTVEEATLETHPV